MDVTRGAWRVEPMRDMQRKNIVFGATGRGATVSPIFIIFYRKKNRNRFFSIRFFSKKIKKNFFLVSDLAEIFRVAASWKDECRDT